MAGDDKLERLAERLTGPDPAAGEAAEEEVHSLSEPERQRLQGLLAQHAAHADETAGDLPAEPDPLESDPDEDEGARVYREAQAAQLFHCFEQAMGRPPATAEEAAEWAAVHPEELPLDEHGQVVPRYPEGS